MKRWLVVLVVGCAGCVADGTESPPPNEETLCELSVGETTEVDARNVLGPADMSTGTSTQQTFVYQYGSETEAVFVMLMFAADGVLIRPVTMGIPFPACWKSVP